MLFSILMAINYLSGIWLHDFHISVADIAYDEQNKAVEIAVRIFVDDLEEGLIVWSGDQKVDVINPKDQVAFNGLLKKYVLENFMVAVNEKTTEMRYLGAEIEDNLMYCYIEIESVKKLKSIEVKNTILMDLYSDQVGLVHVENNGSIQSMKLTTDVPTDTFYYEK